MSNGTTRKSKILAVPISRPEGLAIAQMGDGEAKTEAEEMTELVNEVNAEEELVAEPVATQEDLVAELFAIGDAPKLKVKRAPRAKAEAEPEPEVETVLFVAPQEAERRVGDKIECPDYGKQMSAKTLRYKHEPSCTAKKNRQEERQTTTPSIADEVIEHEVQKRVNNFREERTARKQKASQSLIGNPRLIF
jgi:hypothetical protein